MSMINDALRRAQAAQPQPPPPPMAPVPPRPVEPAQHARHNLGLMVPVSLAMVALFALLFVWQWAQRARHATELQEARALVAPTAPATIAPESTTTVPEAPASAPQPTPVPPPQANPALDTTGADEVPAATPPKPPPPSLTRKDESELTQPAAIAAPVPKPTPLRLQAIVFNPKRPSALINSKTLFVGDKLGDARVVAIGKNSATLVGGGRTNVLILPD
jgi:hypothetical protein